MIFGLMNLYILCLPFQNVSIMFFNFNLVLTEAIFIFTLPLAIIDFIKSKNYLTVNALDTFIVGLIVVNVISGWRATFNTHSLHEIYKIIYLVLFYFTLKSSINVNNIFKIINIYVKSATIASIIGIIGFMASFVGYNSSLTLNRFYPYFGNVHQAMGFTSSPNMLASIIMIALILQLTKLIYLKTIIQNILFSFSSILKNENMLK